IFDDRDDIEDDEVDIVEDDSMELTGMVKEEIVLEMAMEMFCECEEEKGGGREEGKDWEVIWEEEKKNEVDRRLGALEKLLKQDDES
uniref:YceD family protein n=1 Tax=Bacillus subtilis TaxID=1423 RepID=UPI00338D9823